MHRQDSENDYSHYDYQVQLVQLQYLCVRRVFNNNHNNRASDRTGMFNTSKNSSDRSFRREGQSQRGPSTHRSRSARSASTTSRHSDGQLQPWKLPVWVHCEKCFGTHDEANPNILLLSCGHVFCRKCLRVDSCNALNADHVLE